jgi:hypothetical protein
VNTSSLTAQMANLLLVCSLQFLLNFKSRLLLRTIQIQT